MQLISKLTALSAVLVTSAAFASADTLFLGSYGTDNGTNPGFSNTALNYAFVQTPPPAGAMPTGSNIDIFDKGTFNLTNDGTWTGPLAVNGLQSQYVSINPGDGPGGGVVEPNGVYGYHSYFSTPTYANTFSGSISALADDTLDVFLNGTQVIVNSNGNNGGYPHCSASAPNCITTTTALLPNSLFRTDGGPNDLFIEVYQEGLYSTGLDFVGTVTATPEPSTLMLLGTGLVGSAGALFRRMRS